MGLFNFFVQDIAIDLGTANTIIYYQDKVVAALVVPYFDFLDDSHPISAKDAHQYIKQAALDISKALGYAPE